MVIGGTKSFDNDLAALNAIRIEWTSANLYQTRVDHLRGTLAGGANEGTFLAAGTVADDGMKDTLFGGAENDYFWGFSLDTTDKVVGEVLN